MFKEYMAKFRRIDWFMTVSMLALIAFGVLCIWSAGSSRTSESIRTLWSKHLFTGLFGLALYFAFALVDYRRLLDFTAIPVYVVSTVLLVVVLVFGTGRLGAHRALWFFQPAEIAKLTMIALVAHYFAPAGHGRFRHFAIAAALFAVPAALILKEPDLGTTIVLAAITGVMLLAAKVWLKGLISLFVVGLLAAGVICSAVYAAESQNTPEERERIYARLPLRPHQIQRLRAFISPDTDRRGAGYHVYESRLAIGSGSVWGKKLGQGTLAHSGHLPVQETTNDFVFCVLAEETGLMGALLMLSLYLVVILGILRIAFVADDDRGRLFAVGVATMVFCHLFINVGMTIGLMPVTGLPLPFISQGRTFLVVLMIALGIVQSVSVHRELERPNESENL